MGKSQKEFAGVSRFFTSCALFALFAVVSFPLSAQNQPYESWKKQLIHEPFSRSEKKIIKALNIDPAVEGFLNRRELEERAKNLAKLNLNLEALKIYKNLLPNHPDLLDKLADAAFAAREYAEAALLYRRLWDHPAPGQDREKLLSQLATSLVRSDQFDAALHTNREMIRLFPKSRLTKAAEEKIPFITFDSGRYKEAKEGYSQLMMSRKDPREIARFRWRRFWCSYLLREEDQALLDLEFLKKTEKAKPKQRELAYWQARLQEQMGQVRQAMEGYQKIYREKPSDYYGFLSAYRSKRMRMLPNVMIDLNLIASPNLSRQAYPKLYPDWLNESSRENGNDQWLILALIRQESHFKPTAISRSHAIGLMQMIPQTAYQVAGEMQLAEFHHENLFDPVTSIRMGGHHIKTLLNQFEDRLPYAIAAYNAGPEAVTRWRKWGDLLPADEFIELIPYKETREYVKKVLTNYWVYKKLYDR